MSTYIHVHMQIHTYGSTRAREDARERSSTRVVASCRWHARVHVRSLLLRILETVLDMKQEFIPKFAFRAQRLTCTKKMYVCICEYVLEGMYIKTAKMARN